MANNTELIKTLTNDCYNPQELAEQIIALRDAMARYFFASKDMEWDKDNVHARYEFATEFADMIAG